MADLNNLYDAFDRAALGHPAEVVFNALHVPPNLKTWTMVIGSILMAFVLAYWAHTSLG